MATFLGYDPGGNHAHGVAAISVRDGVAESASVAVAATAETAIAWFLAQLGGQKPGGLGVDTLTAHCTGTSGWRPADDTLRSAYPAIANSIASPNSLFGSMGLNGLTVVHELRRVWSTLPVSETHPKVLHYAVTKMPWDFDAGAAEMNAALLGWIGIAQIHLEGLIAVEHQWDALVSAYAVWQGVSGNWVTDLHSKGLDALRHGRRVELCGPTTYFWPNKL